MSDIKSLAEEKQYYSPELDERLWQAWKEKNRLKDRLRAARHKRILVFAGPVAIILVVWRIFVQ